MFSNPITTFFRPLIKDYIIEKTNCNGIKEILNRFVLHESTVVSINQWGAGVSIRTEYFSSLIARIETTEINHWILGNLYLLNPIIYIKSHCYTNESIPVNKRLLSPWSFTIFQIREHKIILLQFKANFSTNSKRHFFGKMSSAEGAASNKD